MIGALLHRRPMQRQKMRTIKAGETVIVTSGVYSDYRVMGMFRCLKDFSPDEEMIKYTRPSAFKKDRDFFEDTKCLAGLCSDRILEEVQHMELHLGDYGDLEEASLQEPKVGAWKV